MSVLPPNHPDGRRHSRRSLAARVTLLTTLAAGATVALVALGAYLTVRMQLQATLDDSLLDRANQAVKSDSVGAMTADCSLPAWAVDSADVRIALVDLDRDPAVQTCYRAEHTLQLGELEADVASGVFDSSIRTLYAGGEPYRVAAVQTSEPREAFVVAQSLEGQQTVLRKLGIVMLLFGLAGVIGAGLAGWAVARSGLRPVRRLTAEVEEIARTEDLHPIPVEGDDEIARLATAFNQMLAALAASRDRQRQLVADAGHELRTPLTSLRTNLDLLTQSDSPGGGSLPAEARAELLEDVRAQIEELTTLIGDLVELARDEPLTHVVEPVDLTEIVDRAIARVRRRAPGLAFDVDLGSWYVVGESASIERAVTNLFDNAAKWSPEDGVVTVRLADGTLTVDDQGPGIAEADRPHVFDRFYRSAESRGMSGSGLGLSIVRQVAERHSGNVEVGDAPSGGARLVMWLPGSASPVPDWTPA